MELRNEFRNIEKQNEIFYRNRIVPKFESNVFVQVIPSPEKNDERQYSLWSATI